MNKVFMTVTVNDQDFDIERYVEEEVDNGVKYKFKTILLGEEHTFQCDAFSTPFEITDPIYDDIAEVLNLEFTTELTKILND